LEALSIKHFKTNNTMKVNKLYIAAFATLSIAFSANAQVKIGSNPTTITANTNLEVEATNGVKSVFSKDLGNAGIGTTNTTSLGTQSFPTRLNVLGAGDNSFIAKFVGTGSNPIWNRVHIEGTNGSMIAINDVTANDGFSIINYVGNQEFRRNTSLGGSGILYTFKSPTIISEANNILLGSINPPVQPISTAAVRISNDAGESSLVTDGSVGVANLDPKNTLHVYGNSIIGYSDIVNTGGWSLVNGDGNNNSCNSSIITGSKNTTAGSYSIVAGQANSTLAGSKNNIVTGDNNSVAGNSNVVLGGRHVIASGANENLVSGYGHAVAGLNSIIGGSSNNINAGANNCLAVGTGNTIAAGHNESVVMGNAVTTTAAAQFRANFSGGIFFNVAPTITSDLRMKKNVASLTYGLTEIMKMRPASYQYKENTTGATNLGFIAQEMVKIVPEVVSVPKNEKDFYSIRYEELIPVLTKGIQEQQAQIEAQKSEINELKAAVKVLLEKK
jgi:hypothetical protein